LDILDKIQIPQDIYDWAMSEIRLENDSAKETREVAILAHRKNYDKATEKIHGLIDMRADNEITKEEYAQRRKEAEKKKDFAELMINRIEGNNKMFFEKIDEVFNFATNVKSKFENGTLAERKDIILNLGSNLQICDKKLMISLDLRLKPFQKYAQGIRQEFTRVKPLDIGLDNRKTALLGTAFPVMSG